MMYINVNLCAHYFIKFCYSHIFTILLLLIFYKFDQYTVYITAGKKNKNINACTANNNNLKLKTLLPVTLKIRNIYVIYSIMSTFIELKPDLLYKKKKKKMSKIL
jgi:hypothetical protein